LNENAQVLRRQCIVAVRLDRMDLGTLRDAQ